MQLNSNGIIYNAALYARLSKEDGDKAESDSITNQKDLIRGFLKTKPEIRLCTEKVDDGYSGVDFNRPAIKELLDDIKAGLINCVVVKDLSRFSRNHIEAGRYIEQIFPFMGVRFIAINDNYDSATVRSQSDNIVIPFKNLVNDAYCRDISVKIRSQFEIKRKRGDFIGSFPVYGYCRSKENRHKLAIDEFAAKTVQDIFKWKLEGLSNQKIADRLNDMGVLSPMEYKKAQALAFQSTFKIHVQAKWSAQSVGRILRNEVYIGVLEQGKESTPNYKVKKRLKKPKDEWIRVADAHEPIVSKAEFAIVNKLLLSDTRIAPSKESVYLFSGLLQCADCGGGMTRKLIHAGGQEYVYHICVANKEDKNTCSNHRISEARIISGVLEALKNHIEDVICIEEMLAYIDTLPLQQLEVQKTDKLLSAKREEAQKYNELKLALYEDYSEGLIDREEYREMKKAYADRCADAEKAVIKLEREIEGLMQNKASHIHWIGGFKNYRNIHELTRKVLISLIDKIVVYDAERIEIVYKYQSEFESAVRFIETAGHLLPMDTPPDDKLNKEAV